jgi:leucyl aminopeptidase (aminopeptidase T)
LPDFFEYELALAAQKLTRDMFRLTKGETFIITADTQSDMRVVEAVAAAAHTLGAKPMVITMVSPLGVGKAADPMLPVDSLTAALLHADAWVEFNKEWLLYSTPFEIATEKNKKLRYMCLVETTVDMMVRLIGRVDTVLLSSFMKRVVSMTQAARHMRITTPAGNDVSCTLLPEDRKVSCDDGMCNTPGMHFLGGQISFIPDFDSIEGRIVFDGTISPPCGFLKESVILDIQKGRVASISGGWQADELRMWLEGFNDPNMFRLAHGCYGFNPGAKLGGYVIEDERVWGCTEWGLGYLAASNAPPDGIQAMSHCDGICLNSSVWLDGKQILENGVLVDLELASLAEPLLRPDLSN